MKGKLEILEEIRSGKTTIEKAKQQVLDLFVVSGSCLFINTLCDECGGYGDECDCGNLLVSDNYH